MPGSRPPLPSWPVVIVGLLHIIYATGITVSWLVGGPTPPAAVGSVIVASLVSAVVLATRRRCDCRTDIAELTSLVAVLTDRLGEIELVPAPRPSEENPPIGMDPKTLGAIHRVDARLRP